MRQDIRKTETARGLSLSHLLWFPRVCIQTPGDHYVRDQLPPRVARAVSIARDSLILRARFWRHLMGYYVLNPAFPWSTFQLNRQDDFFPEFLKIQNEFRVSILSNKGTPAANQFGIDDEYRQGISAKCSSRVTQFPPRDTWQHAACGCSEPDSLLHVVSRGVGNEILNGTLRDQTRNVLTQYTQRVRLVSGTPVFPGTSYFTQCKCFTPNCLRNLEEHSRLM